MYLSSACKKALNIDDFFSSLQPLSELGRKTKKETASFQPGDENKLRKEYKKIDRLREIFQKNSIIESLSINIKHIEDIRMTIEKSKSEILALYEFYEIKSFLFFFQQIRHALSADETLIQWYNFSALFHYLDPENHKTPSFYIANRYSAKLKQIREETATLSRLRKIQKMKEEQKAAEILGVHTAEPKVVVSRYQKELAQKIEASGFYALEDQNFANKIYKFKYSDKILEYEACLQQLLADGKKEEKAVRILLTQEIAKYATELIEAQNEIGKLDWLITRAIFGKKFNLTTPTVSSQPKCLLEHVENLPILWSLKEKNIPYQKTNLRFTSSLNIITGANMAGKTSALKTVGQCFYFASKGIQIPAKKAEIGLADFLYFSSATSESHRKDLSSFGAEVSSLEQVMKKNGKGIFLIDELARGTNPEEGNAFACAILEQFINYEGLVIAATHFQKPASIKKASHFRVQGISLNEYYNLKREQHLTLEQRLKELHLYMNYQLIEVDAATKLPRAALMIADILGINQEIINRAKELL